MELNLQRLLRLFRAILLQSNFQNESIRTTRKFYILTSHPIIFLVKCFLP